MTNLEWEIANNMCVSGEVLAPLPRQTEYTFMEIRAVDENGNVTNERFFEGRLPNIGETVELIYVGSRADGTMRLQLRVRNRTGWRSFLTQAERKRTG